MASTSGNGSVKRKRTKEDLANYKCTLSEEAFRRYAEKLEFISGLDPYEIDDDKFEDQLPSVQYPDIVNYCVFKKSWYTMDEFKAYKSLDAYNQFICGWVSDLRSLKVSSTSTDAGTNAVLVRAKVQHSQSLSKTPLNPWLVAETNGTILAAHCNCMAGLGETCTHVGAVLFAIEASIRISAAKTVTEEAAYWMLPSTKKAPYARIKDINFTSAKSLKRNLDEMIANDQDFDLRSQQKTPLPSVQAPSLNELNQFFSCINQTHQSSAILTVLPEYSGDYSTSTRSSHSSNYPWFSKDIKIILNLDEAGIYTKEGIKLLCEKVRTENLLKTSVQACDEVEMETRKQASSRLWNNIRIGRITASNMKKIFQTKVVKPALSTIKTMCYPSFNLNTPAINWGRKHEEDARKAYVFAVKNSHQEFEIQECGLFIHPEQSYLAATPDGIVTCACHGRGCIEIKCPYGMRDENLADAESNWISTNFENINGKYQLKKSHAHYYQIQTQMLVTKCNYTDYVVWSRNKLFIERIFPDKDLWERIMARSELFFFNVLLPELICKFYTENAEI